MEAYQCISNFFSLCLIIHLGQNFTLLSSCRWLTSEWHSGFVGGMIPNGGDSLNLPILHKKCIRIKN